MAKKNNDLEELREIYASLKKGAEDLRKNLTEDELKEIWETNKDLSDRMHWEFFGCLPGETPPEEEE